MSESLFTLLVAGGLDDDSARSSLIARCVREIEDARRVVSAPGLVNRLWLGPGFDGYEGPAAYALIGDMPRIAQLVSSSSGPQDAPPQPAVPLGAIVEVNLGQRSPSIAEVVWKEGAHQALSGAYLPKWLAGAPALPDSLDDPVVDADTDAHPVLRERLVLDFSCFGEASAPTAQQLTRLCSNARWIDHFGHLVLDVEYEPGNDEDDVSYWATWLATHAAKALEVADVQLDSLALRRCLGQLLEALSEDTSVRTFGPYLMSSAHYQDLRDEYGDIYESVARGLAHVHRGDRRAWGSMSQRLVECIPDRMFGIAWADHVMAASLYVLDTLSVEAPGGDWDGVHLRLDDAWQGGGLWRAENLDEVAPLALDPAIALGLGWAEYTGQLGDVPQELRAPAWFADADDGEDEAEWSIHDSEVVWSVHLSARDIDANRLVVPPRVRPGLELALASFGQSKLMTQIHHEGASVTYRWGPLSVTGHLEVEWPPTVQVGTIFSATWSMEGQPLVRVYSRRLTEPVEIGGVTYLHDFDEQMVRAYLGLIERPAQVVTLDRLVRAAVRHYGELAPNGQWCLSADEICAKCFGPQGEVAPEYQSFVLRRAVDAAVMRLVRAGRATRQGPLILVADTTRLSNEIDRVLLDRYVEGQAQRLRRAASRAWVAASVVNLPAGWRASPEKRARWEEVAGTDQLPAGELGPQQTWRQAHVRGDVLSSHIERELDRTARAMAELGASPEQLNALREAVQSPHSKTDSLQETSNDPTTPHGEEQ